MYSPKIKEDLIPIIYTKAKEKKIPMTKLVNDILRDKLKDTGDTMYSNTDKQMVSSPVNCVIEI